MLSIYRKPSSVVPNICGPVCELRFPVSNVRKSKGWRVAGQLARKWTLHAKELMDVKSRKEKRDKSPQFTQPRVC